MRRQYPKEVDKNNVVSVVRDIIELRQDDLNSFNRVRNGKLKGRNRTGVRAVPTASDDTQAGDIEGDTLTDATYRYTLVDAGGTLKWDRQTLSVSW